MTIIYDFTDYREFLHAHMVETKMRREGFSTRLWSKKLGLSSPATLSMILAGKRFPGRKLQDRLSKYFDFGTQESQYFEQLIRLAQTKINGQSEEPVVEELRKLRPELVFRSIDVESFRCVAQWFCFALQEMVGLADFELSYEWFNRRVRRFSRKVSEIEFREAAQILVSRGLLAKGENGKYHKTDAHVGFWPSGWNEAGRCFHEQMIENAKTSIRKIPMEKRVVTGTTFNIDPANVSAVKEKIRGFWEQIVAEFETPLGTGLETYQLNVQFFPLTEAGGEGSR